MKEGEQQNEGRGEMDGDGKSATCDLVASIQLVHLCVCVCVVLTWVAKGDSVRHKRGVGCSEVHCRESR